MADSQKKAYTFLIVGKVGNGKSSTGNSILRTKKFSVAHSFSSNDVECQIRSEGDITVVCAPDLQHKKFMDKDSSLEEVKLWLAIVGREPDAIILVMRCDSRSSPEEIEGYQDLKKALQSAMEKRYGPSRDYFKEKLVIVFTFGDCLNGQELRELLNDPDFKDVQKIWKNDAKERYVVFHNRAEEEAKLQVQVQALMDIIEKKEPHPFPQHVCRLLVAGKKEALQEVHKQLELNPSGDKLFSHFNLDGLEVEMTFLPAVEDYTKIKDQIEFAASPGPHAILLLRDGREAVERLFGSWKSDINRLESFVFDKGIQKVLSSREKLKESLYSEEFPARKNKGDFFQNEALQKKGQEIHEETMELTELNKEAAAAYYETYLDVKEKKRKQPKTTLT